MLSSLTNFGFTIAFFAAVVATAVFGFGFDSALELISTMFLIGFATAMVQHYLRSHNEPQ